MRTVLAEREEWSSIVDAVLGGELDEPMPGNKSSLSNFRVVDVWVHVINMQPHATSTTSRRQLRRSTFECLTSASQHYGGRVLGSLLTQDQNGVISRTKSTVHMPSMRRLMPHSSPIDRLDGLYGVRTPYDPSRKSPPTHVISRPVPGGENVPRGVVSRHI